MSEAPVLIIDDEAFLLSFFTDALGRSGMKAVGASSGREALKLLEKCEFAGIVSDVRMADVDGASIFDWVRKHRPELCKSFLFITGDANAPDVVRIRERTGARFLEKPFGIAQMVAVVREIVGRGEARDA